MKFRRKSMLILAVIMAGLWGCASTPDSVERVVKVMYLGPDTNHTGQVEAGKIMLQTQKGDFFNAYELSEAVRGSFLGNSCTVSPQLLINIRQDDEFYYGISGKDYAKPSPMNWQMKDYLRTCPCGVKFSKKDLKVVEVVFEHKNGSLDKMGTISINDNARPVLKQVTMIDMRTPGFLRKTLKFDSFADDFLTLRYMEERGNPVAVAPDVTERMYEFDLQTSKTINVQGAKIEILDARPGKLTYKIIRQMSVE